MTISEPQSYRVSMTHRQRRALTRALAAVSEHYYDPTIIDRWMSPLSIEEIEDLMTRLLTPDETDGDIADLHLASDEVLNLVLAGVWIDRSLPGISVNDLEEIEDLYSALETISDRYW